MRDYIPVDERVPEEASSKNNPTPVVHMGCAFFLDLPYALRV